MKKSVLSCVMCALVCFCMFCVAHAFALEKPAIFDYVGYNQYGFIAPCQAGYLCLYDVESAIEIPLCTHPQCLHEEIEGEIKENEIEFLNDASFCYARRIRNGTQHHLMYEGKMYFTGITWPNTEKKTFDMHVFESEIDGETKYLASLGALFSWDRMPEITGFMVYDTNAYVVVMESENPWLYDNEKPLEQLDNRVTIFAISLKSGEVKKLYQKEAQTVEIYMMGISSNVLYYQETYADDMKKMQENVSIEEILKEIKSKTMMSIKGVHVSTGKQVQVNQRLNERKFVDFVPVFTLENNVLRCIIDDEKGTDAVCAYLKIDVDTQEVLAYYPFKNHSLEDEYYVYAFLTEEDAFVYNFSEGKYALQNLKTGKLYPLTLPGNIEKLPYYSISFSSHQTHFIPFEYYKNTEEKKWAFMLLEGLKQGEYSTKEFE